MLPLLPSSCGDPLEQPAEAAVVKPRAGKAPQILIVEDNAATDLSIGGMLVQASRLLPLGSKVQISLELSTGTAPVRAAGRVVRLIGDDCMGLQLENVRMADQDRLQEFLLSLTAKGDDQKSPARPRG